ncbi:MULTISPECIES: histidine phosphatase family protein [Microbacterium]|uniref:Histidine phosphatase family protein n=1 Tax=Microbacterium wangchenii TaxID=2541726 RepID=A0ABX5SRG9_9MICO|nr:MULTISPECIES: histidine phosphatase family protein [Microbacterium]MCK6064934.1 histidine phosphatase family protein [Microbacterium sp. EYE_512]QBR88412.1 histidine phosphatase family protein [Microbacterium wangchenii]TXK20139.1 histidine phosphatase family protein [Microbacterium wangchenii]
MTTRHLYIARHGAADPFGTLTETGRRQAELLGKRLAALPITAIWHSPLPRAAATALELVRHLTDAPVAEAAELIDNIPYVPPAETMPASWAGFFDGYAEADAAAGRRTADALTERFATAGPAGNGVTERHEVLITHDYPIAWLVRHALEAPPARWLDLTSANAGLTVLTYRAGAAPTIMMFNDMSHLPVDLRWTGFRPGLRP